jgi:hypothetical protein
MREASLVMCSASMPSAISSPSTFADIFCSHWKAPASSGERRTETSTGQPRGLSVDSTPRSTSSMNSSPSCSTSVSGPRLAMATSPTTSLRPRTMLWAALSGTYPRASMTSSTRRLVDGRTPSRPCTTRETVAVETFASRATSYSVLADELTRPVVSRSLAVVSP